MPPWSGRGTRTYELFTTFFRVLSSCCDDGRVAVTRQALLSSIRDLGAAGAGITATVLLLAVPGVPNPTIAALALLLIVLGAATLSTRVVAMVASLAATLSFNYYFLPPYGTFAVADSQH